MQPAEDISLPSNGRNKGIAEDGYETGLDVDTVGLGMMKEMFIQLEVRLEVSMRTIAISMDRDLLKITENVVPTLGPLCSDVEGETLRELYDVTLSRSIVGLALRVSILGLHYPTSILLCFVFVGGCPYFFLPFLMLQTMILEIESSLREESKF